jgi:hypothetical protein
VDHVSSAFIAYKVLRLTEDIDWGKGINPVADKAWMDNLIREGKWSRKVYEVKNVVSRPVGKIHHSTVFLDVVNTEHRKLLRKLRGVLGYKSDALVRVPRSNFNRGEEKKWIEELDTANPEDPAPCKHRVLAVSRHSKGA